MKPIRNPRQLSLFTSSHEIDVQRAARLLSTTCRNVRRMLESGKLAGYQLNPPHGWWKISYDSVVAYINKIKLMYLPDQQPTPPINNRTDRTNRTLIP